MADEDGFETTASASIIFDDELAPVPLLSSAVGSATNLASIPVDRKTFPEAVTGFDYTDIQINGGLLNNFTGDPDHQSKDQFNVINPPAPLRVDVAAGAAKDLMAMYRQRHRR